MSSLPVRVSTARAVTGREMASGSAGARRPSATTVEVHVSPRLPERATSTLTSGSFRFGSTPLMPQYRALLRPHAIGVSLR